MDRGKLATKVRILGIEAAVPAHMQGIRRKRFAVHSDGWSKSENIMIIIVVFSTFLLS